MSKALLTCPAPREEVGLQLRFRGPPPFPVCVFHPLLLLLLSRFSRVRLCDPTNGSPPGSPIPGILQARTLGCHFLLQCMKVKSESEVTQSCLTPSDPKDCSLPGSSVHGIFQARVLEWGAIAFSESKLVGHKVYLYPESKRFEMEWGLIQKDGINLNK